MISSSNVNKFANFVKDNIKNNIDLNSGNSTKNFTITLSSSNKNYKSSNTDNSLNVKSDIMHDIFKKTEKFHKTKILVMAL